jgi:hypothetical protein
VQLPNKPYHLLSPQERTAALEEICRELYGLHLELSEVRVQYLWAYAQAYKAAQSPHVGGRIQEAEIAAAGIKEDELQLLGRIDALSTMRDYLAR